ncbi:SymE family type I addiction module toxin [Parabacteroides provencensis]|uniref:SymE family type I addiction module toxin n=1 Tax=Parabacteroides provencensis TaxID=1944636 RepID=UPI000C14B322|nr:SymE family type I addiction module toxin [Parabacteroides provencensis]
MLTKLLKVCGLPTQNNYTAGINLKGEYLKDYGFNIGDYVHVEVTENRIVITKDTETNIVSLFSRKNKVVDNLIDTFDLTLPKRG